MKKPKAPDRPTCLSVELFLPKPATLYSLDAAAHLAGVPRRTILRYCRSGLVRPVIQPPYGRMEFTEEAIRTVRRIEHMRTVQGLELAWIQAILELRAEVERLGAELRFWRDRR